MPQTFKLLFVPIKWSDTTDAEVASWNENSVREIADYVRRHYLANSYGQLTFDITVTPWIRVSAPKLTAVFGSCQDAWSPNNLPALGFNKADWFRIGYFCPGVYTSNKKGGAGVTDFWTYNCMGSGYARKSAIHELGHTFGLPHPQLLRLPKLSGTTITMPPLTVHSSPDAMYGSGTNDATTPMGYEDMTPHFSGWEKASLNSIDDWVVPVRHPNGADVTYNIAALSEPLQPGQVHCVQVQMSGYYASSGRVYWIERREPWGEFDGRLYSNLRGGLIVRMQGDFNLYAPSRLEFTPGVPGSDYPNYGSVIPPGYTLTDGSIDISYLGDGQMRICNAGGGISLPPPPVQVINYFKAEPSTVIAGEATKLYWSTSNATGAVLDGTVVPVNKTDGMEVKPTMTRSYSFGITGSGPYVQSVVTVTVQPAVPPNPNIATLASLQPLVAGMTPTTITQAQKDQVALLAGQLVVS